MKNLQSLSSLSNLGNPSSNSFQYILYDKFITTVSAGSVNNTLAEPTAQIRKIVDTNTKLSISGGVFNFATGEASNDGIIYPTVQRNAGRILLASITPADTSGNTTFGWGPNNNAPGSDIIRFNGGGSGVIGIVANSTGSVLVATISGATTYQVAEILRANGVYFFIKGGAFTYWTLLWHYPVGNSTLHPLVYAGGTTAVSTLDNIRVPKSLWLPQSSAYDTFTRANGALGSSETTGPDSQVVGSKAWTDTLGTWAIASDVAGASATSGGSAFETLDAGVADIIIDAAVTRSAGVAGIVLRYKDSSNYVIAYHDGTNCKLDKVIGGSTTNVKSAVATYSAGATLRVITSGSSFRLFYNNAAVSTVGTISDAAVQTTTLHGLYTTSTSNTFDNFLIFPVGTNNEHGILDSF